MTELCSKRRPQPGWIQIGPHKNEVERRFGGRASEDVGIRSVRGCPIEDRDRLPMWRFSIALVLETPERLLKGLHRVAFVDWVSRWVPSRTVVLPEIKASPVGMKGDRGARMAVEDAQLLEVLPSRGIVFLGGILPAADPGFIDFEFSSHGLEGDTCDCC
jgi:hypothetical protein